MSTAVLFFLLVLLPVRPLAATPLVYPFGSGHYTDLPAVQVPGLQSAFRQFTVYNPQSVSASVVIEVGNLPDSVQLFQEIGHRLQLLDRTGELMARLPRRIDSSSYLRTDQVVLLTLYPGQTATFRLRLTNCTRLATHTFPIRLYTPDAYRMREAVWLYEAAYRQRLIGAIFWGISGVLFLFTGLQYILLRERLYGYYALYLLLVLLRIMLYSEQFVIDHWPGLRELGFVGRLSMVTIFWSFAAYTFFVREYIGLDRWSPRLDTAFRVIGWFMIGLGGMDVLVTMQRIYVDFWRFTYHGLEVGLLAFSFFSLWVLGRHYDSQVRYLFWGVVFLMLGGVASLIHQQIQFVAVEQFQETLIWMMAYLAELLSFSLGLIHRQQRVAADRFTLQQQVIDQLKENQHRQEQLFRLRGEIARDLHDELGSELSSISILSQLVRGGLTQHSSQSQTTLDTIGETARRVMDRMRDIVWSLQQEPTQEMAGHLRDLISRQVEHAPIRAGVAMPDRLPSALLPPNQWRQLLLILREALHNVIKHAQATEVRIELVLEADQLLLVVEDNGVGFVVNAGDELPGTGLRSQQHRATALGGQILLKSVPGQGTRVSLLVPLYPAVSS